MLKHMRTYLALAVMAAVFLLTAAPVSALFAREEPQGDAGAPAAADLTLETYQGTSCTGVFSAEDEEGGQITYTLAAEPKKGTVAVGEDGMTFVYTPTGSKSGKDSFTFTAADSEGNTSAPATVTVNIAKKKTEVSYCDMAGNKAYPAAICLAENGIYVGRQVGESWFFSPEEEVSRSEFLAMAMETAGMDVSPDVRLTGFADDAAIPTWAKGYASAAVREGVVQGVTTAQGVSFCGEDTITLAEAAAVMDRLLDVADVPVEETAGESWAAQAVANMASVSVVSAGSFGPSEMEAGITRAQAAEMLAAAVELIESQEDSGGLFGWLK